MKISLISTVLNEARSLPTLLDSIAAQTRLPDEVIICDGGSTDNTIDLLRAERRFPLRVIERPGANISQGRNLAIAEASGEVIACVDAGVRLDPQWLEKLVEPMAPSPTLPVLANRGGRCAPVSSCPMGTHPLKSRWARRYCRN